MELSPAFGNLVLPLEKCVTATPVVKSNLGDSLTIIVSEETGQVSMAQNGQLSRGLTSAELRSALIKAQNKKVVTNSKLRHLLKGRMRHEEDKAD